MSQRSVSRLLSKFSQEEQALLQEGIDRIHASRGLRLLLWRFFESCNMAQSPFSPDPLTTARNCGTLEAAISLRELIESIDPDLFLALQTEMTNYDRTRADQLHDRYNDSADD